MISDCGLLGNCERFHAKSAEFAKKQPSTPLILAPTLASRVSFTDGHERLPSLSSYLNPDSAMEKLPANFRESARIRFYPNKHGQTAFQNFGPSGGPISKTRFFRSALDQISIGGDSWAIFPYCAIWVESVPYVFICGQYGFGFSNFHNRRQIAQRFLPRAMAGTWILMSFGSYSKVIVVELMTFPGVSLLLLSVLLTIKPCSLIKSSET